jgi:hypothetical protein
MLKMALQKIFLTRVLLALEDEKMYLRDGAYKLSYRVKKGKASHVSVEIYVRGGTAG